MNRLVVAIPSGFAVAYRRPNGELCSLSEHADRQGASRECQRLQLVERMEKHAAERNARRQHALWAQRRPVRWFPADEFV